MKSIRWATLSAMTALAALSLAGCKKEAVVAKNESAESVAKKVEASNLKPRAGRWELTMKIAKMDMPGIPPDAKAMMDKQMGQPTSFATCLTPQQAEKPDAGFFQKNASGCTYDHFVMTDGKIDAAMSCGQAGHTMKVTMMGDYTPEAYNVHASSQGEMAPGKTMSVDMSITSHRVGECNGSEDK